ncbi:DNA mismatch repair protein MSH6 [Kwoniella heveanensis CBS 569]|nr:DNA mismatch repair protein MSH6 [Kwoniella heveanensis CBS 569]
MAKTKPDTPKDSKSTKQSTLAAFFGAPKAGPRPPTVKASQPFSSPATAGARNGSSLAGSSPAAPPVRATQGQATKRASSPAKASYVASEDDLTPPPESGPSSAAKAGSNGKNANKDVIEDEDVDMAAGSDGDGSPVPLGRRAKRKVMYVESDSEASSGEDVRKSKPTAGRGRGPRKSLKADSDSDEFVFDDADDAAFAAAAEEYEASIVSRSPSTAFSASPEPVKKKAQPKKGFVAPKRVPPKPTTSWNRPLSPSGSSPVSRPGPRPNQNRGESGPSSANAVARSTDSNSFLLTAAERKKLADKETRRESEQCFEFLVDIKDKNGNRPNDPDYDKRTIYIPKSSWNHFTPFEKQFWEIKQDHYDTVLFFQKGKFYELYEDDAMIGHQEFDLKLTDRVKMKMVGVPEQSLEFWVQKFLGAGYKVGKVEQAETAIGMEMRTKNGGKSGGTAKSKEDKIVRRELKQVFTNGTIVDGHYLSSGEPNHCVSIKENISESTGNSAFGICVMDASTGSFDLCTFEDDICRTRLETMFRQIRPKELVYAKGNLSVETNRMLRNILPVSALWQSFKNGVEFCSASETLNRLSAYFSIDGSDSEKPALPEAIEKLRDNELAMEAFGGLLFYIKTLQLDKDLVSQKNFNIYDPIREGKSLILDGQTLGHMEVLVNGEGGLDGTLLQLLQRGLTPFGKRLFKIWLMTPLRDAQAINDRLDAVDDLMSHPEFISDFTQICKGLPDLERLISRIHANGVKQKDFKTVVESFVRLQGGLEKLTRVAATFETTSIACLLRSAPDLSQYTKHIQSLYKADQDEKSITILPLPGADEDCDEADAAVKAIEAELNKILLQAQKQLGSKEVKFWHSSLGNKEIFQIEVPIKIKAPSNWVKQSQTKQYHRYYAPTALPLIRQVQEARETQSTAKKNFFGKLLAEFDKDRTVWLQAVKVISELDCLISLAKSSSDMDEPKCRPEFVDSPSAFVDFADLRHPSMCLRADFISNDVQLGAAQPRQVLLTGPNMAGKSTLLRMTAAGVILAQLGCYVPASRARLSPVDRIQTRMGAYDNMFASASTFKVELDECSKILREAGPKSLVILDELGRGTSTYDGMAIAGAVLHHLATHTLPLGFFATHYGSLTDDFTYHPNIRKMHMQTHVDDQLKQVVFLYKLIPGVAESSHGTHVARMAGVPAEVVTRAEDVSDQFFAAFNAKLSSRRQSSLPLEAQADFAWLMRLVQGCARVEGVASDGDQLGMVRRALEGYIGGSGGGVGVKA